MANATLIFNSWLKDIDMCVWDCDLTEHESVKLIKDYMTEQAHGAVEFYLNTNNQQSYSKLTKHLRMSFESGETFSSLLSNFYVRCQTRRDWGPICRWTASSDRKNHQCLPKESSKVNEALKTVCPQAVGANILQPWPAICWKWHCLTWHSQSSRQNEYPYLGPGLEREGRTISSNIVKTDVSKADQLAKSVNQLCRLKRRKRLKPQQVYRVAKEGDWELESHKYATGPTKYDRDHDTGHGLYV